MLTRPLAHSPTRPLAYLQLLVFVDESSGCGDDEEKHRGDEAGSVRQVLALAIALVEEPGRYETIKDAPIHVHGFHRNPARDLLHLPAEAQRPEVDRRLYGEDEADGEGVEEYGLEELKVRCDGIAEAPMNRLDVFCMVGTEGV